MSIAQPAASALLQAGLRQRLIDVKQALALRHVLIGCGDDAQAVKARLAQNPVHLPEPAAQQLVGLLPAAGSPVIAGHRLLARLGTGRLGVTWLALSEGGQLAVVKEFHPTLVPTAADADALCRDLQPLACGSDRYLVNYLGVARTAASVALVAEYRQGRDTVQRAAVKGNTSEARALTILRQAAKGLAVLHHRGCCHGHLHPGNILLDTDGRAALGDYGLCARTGAFAPRAGWSAVALGRHSWAAPEELGAEPQPGLAADIYALGCIGYWLLTGQPPFPGSAEKQLQQHLGAERPDVRTVAEGISELTAKTLFKMMMQDPAARYGDARSLVHSLERDLDELDRGRVGSAVIRAPSALELRDRRDLRDDSEDGSSASSLILMEPQ